MKINNIFKLVFSGLLLLIGILYGVGVIQILSNFGTLSSVDMGNIKIYLVLKLILELISTVAYIFLGVILLLSVKKDKEVIEPILYGGLFLQLASTFLEIFILFITMFSYVSNGLPLWIDLILSAAAIILYVLCYLKKIEGKNAQCVYFGIAVTCLFTSILELAVGLTGLGIAVNIFEIFFSLSVIAKFAYVYLIEDKKENKNNDNTTISE